MNLPQIYFLHSMSYNLDDFLSNIFLSLNSISQLYLLLSLLYSTYIYTHKHTSLSGKQSILFYFTLHFGFNYCHFIMEKKLRALLDMSTFFEHKSNFPIWNSWITTMVGSSEARHHSIACKVKMQK